MKVSVLIPTHNRAAYLSQAINSVLGQTYPNIEIIVVDDGSVDATAEVLRSYGRRITSYRQDAGGKSRALNRALGHASGDAIIVLDDDDIFPCHAVHLHVAALMRRPSPGFSYGRFRKFRPTQFDDRTPLLPICEHEEIQSGDTRRTVIRLLESCFLPNPTWMATRDALTVVGPYDEALLRSQDFDMILRLARRWEGEFVDDIVLLQRQHDAPRPGVVRTVGNASTRAAWEHFDRAIMTRVDRTWDILDFRPFHHTPKTTLGERQCHLQKGVLLYQRGLSEEAFTALDKFAQMSRLGETTREEEQIASRMFLKAMPFLPESRAPTLPRAPQNMRSLGLPGPVALSIVKGGRWHIRAALERGEPAAALKALVFLCTSFGYGLTLRSLRG